MAGACFADAGTDVTCVDVNQARLDELEAGKVPFFEPGLEAMVARNHRERLHFTTDLASALDGRSIAFIAVGTPPNDDGSADLSYVLGVAKDVARLATGDIILVLKSTVPLGTNQKVRDVVDGCSHKISVVSNPEFLKEGAAIGDFLKPDRVVIGTDDDHAFEMLSRLYAPFNRQRDRLQRMSPVSAEIVKYSANALLATKISFMNEIALLCDQAGADVEDVRLALGSDRRIGYEFLYPGLGFGGSCFPKDLRALVHTAAQLGVKLQVTQAAVDANREPVKALLRHMEKDLGGLKGKAIAVWGLAFKPGTDDVREAPAITLIQELLARGASVRATDPQALATAKARFEFLDIKGVELNSDSFAICEGADALVLATEWSAYRSPDAAKLAQLMTGRHIFDGRNAMVKGELVDAGFIYRGVGRS